MIESLALGYKVPKSDTFSQEMDPNYDNTLPRYVVVSSMPSEMIAQPVTDSGSSLRLVFPVGNSHEQTAYGKADAMMTVISQEELACQKRYKRLLKSFNQHKGDRIDKMRRMSFEKMAGMLSSFNFSDSFVEYSEKGDMIDFSLLFENGLELTVGKYFEVDEKDVVAYSVSYNDELVISNMIKLPTLKTKFSELLAEFE